MDLILRLLQDIFLIGVLFPIGVVVYTVFEVIIDYIKNWWKNVNRSSVYDTWNNADSCFNLYFNSTLKGLKMRDFDDSDVFLMLLVIVFCIFYMLTKWLFKNFFK